MANNPNYVLEDPRPIAKEAPYTFFLPSPKSLALLRPGDKAYLDFRAVPQRQKWESERMWVVITDRNGGALRGVLDHEPDDMPGVHKGEIVDFETWHVLQTTFADPSVEAQIGDGAREYWERCLVDQAILEGKLKVGYLYREDADMGEPDDTFPDSGWRIRADMRGCSDEEISERQASYVALGAVLNRDDSWLALIDEPVGSDFERDFESGGYMRVGNA